MIEVVEQMLKYDKFFKDIIWNKQKWEEHETVILTEDISVILQRKFPPKLKDPL